MRFLPVAEKSKLDHSNARVRSGDPLTQRKWMHFGRRLPFPIENGEVKFLIPFTLEQRVFAIVRLETHSQLLHQLGRVMVAAIAAHENPVDAEMVECEVQHRCKGFGEEAMTGIGRVDGEAQLPLTRRGIRPME